MYDLHNLILFGTSCSGINIFVGDFNAVPRTGSPVFSNLLIVMFIHHSRIFFQSFAVGSKFKVHKLGRCSGCFSDKNKTFWPNLSVRLVEKTEQKLFETFNEQVFSEIVVPNLLWVVLRKPKNVRMGHLCGRVCEWTMKIRTRCDVTKNHHSQIELICNNSGVWCLAFVCVLGSRQSSVSTAL